MPPACSHGARSRCEVVARVAAEGAAAPPRAWPFCAAMHPPMPTAACLHACPCLPAPTWPPARLHIDDPVDAAPVHLFCGAWGLLAVGFFATETSTQLTYGYADGWGVFYGSSAKQLGMQVRLLGSALMAWPQPLAAIVRPCCALARQCGCRRP